MSVNLYNRLTQTNQSPSIELLRTAADRFRVIYDSSMSPFYSDYLLCLYARSGILHFLLHTDKILKNENNYTLIFQMIKRLHQDYEHIQEILSSWGMYYHDAAEEIDESILLTTISSLAYILYKSDTKRLIQLIFDYLKIDASLTQFTKQRFSHGKLDITIKTSLPEPVIRNKLCQYFNNITIESR